MLAPDGKPLNAKGRTELEKGDIFVNLTAIAGSAVKKSVAVALVDAPPESVFAALSDYPNFPAFMPYCKTVTVRKKEGNRSTVYFKLDFPWPIGDRHYELDLVDKQHEIAGKPVYTSTWTYVPGSGNINDSYGSWEVRAYDATRSFVRYTVFTDPGGTIPNWANNMATEVAVPKVIHGLRKRVEEGPSKKTE